MFYVHGDESAAGVLYTAPCKGGSGVSAYTSMEVCSNQDVKWCVKIEGYILYGFLGPSWVLIIILWLPVKYPKKVSNINSK